MRRLPLPLALIGGLLVGLPPSAASAAGKAAKPAAAEDDDDEEDEDEDEDAAPPAKAEDKKADPKKKGDAKKSDDKKSDDKKSDDKKSDDKKSDDKKSDAKSKSDDKKAGSDDVLDDEDEKDRKKHEAEEAARKAAEAAAEAAAKKKAEEDARRAEQKKAAADKRKADTRDERLASAKAVRPLLRNAGGVVVAVAIEPGAIEAGKLTEIRFDIGKRLDVVDPKYGNREPLRNLELVAHVIDASSKKPVQTDYAVHSLGAPGAYGVHVTLPKNGVYQLQLTGSTSSGSSIDVSMPLHVGVWPPPDFDDEDKKLSAKE